MTKKILLIDSGDGGKSFIFDLIKNKNLEIYLAVPREQSWMDEVTSQERRIVCDVYDWHSLQNAVQEYLTKNHVEFDGVGTYYDFFVVQAAKLGEMLQLPQNPVASAQRSSANKFLMRETCQVAGIDMPHYTLIENANRDSLHSAIHEFGFPCVVKPIIGSKSFGVKKFEQPFIIEDLEELFNLTDEEEKELFKNFTGDFLIEEYLSGPVVSVDGFVQHNNTSIAGVIEFVMGPEPHFTQEANYIPTRFKTEINQACIDYTQHVIRALQFDNCGFHCELRVTSNGPKLIEIAARLPGGPLQLGYKQAYGYNLAQNLVDIWLDIDTKLTQTKSSYIVQKAVYDYTPGRLTTFEGLGLVSAHPTVWANAQITPKSGKIKTYPDVPNPIYFYAAEADSPATLEQNEQEIEGLIHYKITPDNTTSLH
jgi:biotin carboxylase